MPGNSPPVVLYQSFFEPVPLPNESVYGVEWGNGNFPARADIRRPRPVAEGLSAVIPQSAIDLVVTQYDWRGGHADSVARRKPLVAEGLSYVDPSAAIGLVVTQMDWRGQHPDAVPGCQRAVTELRAEMDYFSANQVVEEMTIDRWAGRWPDRLVPRPSPVTEGLLGLDPDAGLAEVFSRSYWDAVFPDWIARRRWATYEGLEGIDPYAGLADVTQYRWRGAHADSVAGRKRPVSEGLFSIDPYAGHAEVADYRWRGSHADSVERRKRATHEGLESVDPQTAIDYVVTQLDWRGWHADSVASRRRPVAEGLLGLDVSANFAAEIITSDKWASYWPDRADFRRTRATYEGLEGIDPYAGLAEVATYGWRGHYSDWIANRKHPIPEGLFAFEPQSVIDLVASQYDWRGFHADYVPRRKRATYEGLEGIDVSENFVAETITIDKWRGYYADRADIRPKKATYEGLEGYEPQFVIADVASRMMWRGAHADSVARRAVPVREGLVPAVLHEVFVVPTLDRWAPTYLDRYVKRPWPVQEGDFARDLIEGPPVAPEAAELTKGRLPVRVPLQRPGQSIIDLLRPLFDGVPPAPLPVPLLVLAPIDLRPLAEWLLLELRLRASTLLVTQSAVQTATRQALVVQGVRLSAVTAAFIDIYSDWEAIARQERDDAEALDLLGGGL